MGLPWEYFRVSNRRRRRTHVKFHVPTCGRCPPRLPCRGCRCDVWLTIVEIEPGIYKSKCEHDDNCPLWIKRRCAQWN